MEKKSQDTELKNVKMPLFPPKAMFVWKRHKGALFLTGVQAIVRVQPTELGQCTLIKDIHNLEISTQKNGEILKDVKFEMTRTSTSMPCVTKTPWWQDRGLTI